MKRIEYKQGDIINGVVFIESFETSPRSASFMCFCGNIFTCHICSVKTGNTRSCGCWAAMVKGTTVVKHGMSGVKRHPIYKVWCGIKTRCYNKNRQDYKYYGGRGIKMASYFKNDFICFYNYVTNLPLYNMRDKLNLTLDRIENNGDYKFGNLRWATKFQQANNTTKTKIKCAA